MPLPFGKKKRGTQEPAREQRGQLTRYLSDGGSNEAPIYKAEGGNKFDEFIKERDEAGVTDDMANMRTEVMGPDGRLINPGVISIAMNGIPTRIVEEKAERWGIGSDAVKEWGKEPIEKTPVFETHSFFKVKWGQTGKLHSFVGLRFTGVDDSVHSCIYNDDTEVAKAGMKRHRLVVGYGSGDTVMGSNSGKSGGGGRLMDDSNHAVTASTETPIDNKRARLLLDAIPRFHQKFNYNGLLANCNDFAMTMCRLIGVRAPAELLNHGTGPVMAAGAMKRSAGKKQQGGTEIITRANAEPYGEYFDVDLLPVAKMFESDIYEAIAQDGGSRKLPGVEPVVKQIIKDIEEANIISSIRLDLSNNVTHMSPAELEQTVLEFLPKLESQLLGIIDMAKQLVVASENKKHPNVNGILWKLIVTMEKHYEQTHNLLNMRRVSRAGRIRRESEARRAAAAAAQTPPSGAGTRSATPATNLQS